MAAAVFKDAADVFEDQLSLRLQLPLL